MKRYIAIPAAVLLLVALLSPVNPPANAAPRAAEHASPVPGLSSPHTGNTTNAEHGHTGLVVDTDMGLDDVRAVFALLADQSIEIECFVTVEGSASIGKGLDNLLGLLESVHIETVPIFGGRISPGSSPPAWRHAANTLGGASFPPPRELSPSPGGVHALERLLEAHGEEVEYLALGPLDNLADLLTEHDGGAPHIRTVWIPARTGDGSVECWNLSYDERSTGAVFAGAGDIVIVDMTPAGGMDAAGILDAVRGTAPAARWIRETIADPGTRRSHLALFDELAALLAVTPGLRDIGQKRYRIDGTGGTWLLREDTNGNVRIASMKNPAALAARLKNLWEKQIRQEHHHAPAGTDAESVKGLLETFHGHLGPYVVLGHRMGRIALERLGSSGHFGISASVHSVLEPPASCLIDGVQLGSGCTLGKRNIELFEIDGPAFAVFESEDGGAVIIRLRPEVPAVISGLIAEMGVEQAGEIFMTKEAGEIFIIEQAPRRER